MVGKMTELQAAKIYRFTDYGKNYWHNESKCFIYNDEIV